MQLEAKIKEKEEQIDILKTETATRVLELEEQRQQMSVLWDLGGKVCLIYFPGGMSLNWDE